jgi:hypothetical protein
LFHAGIHPQSGWFFPFHKITDAGFTKLRPPHHRGRLSNRQVFDDGHNHTGRVERLIPLIVGDAR